MYERILVPLDGSELAEAALAHASEMAKKFGASIVLLQVVHTFAETLQDTRPAGGLQTALDIELSVDVARQQVEAESSSAGTYLDGIRQRLTAEGLTVTAEVREGRPAKTILDYADDARTSLIVMSTHGRGGISRLLAGSVADEVIRGAKVPILLARPPS